MIDFAKVLNPEQCAAATAGDGPLLVLAAAGTGKTRTLVHRVAYLVEKGISPSRLLLLTFTNRAAREMLERAEKLVPDVNGIWSGTFHHVSARLLRQYGGSLGYKPGFQILDEEDAKKLMSQCIKENVKDSKDFPKREVLLKLISDAANRERDLERHILSMQTRMAIDPEAVMKVCRAYATTKFNMGAMDFDDLLVNGLRLLKEDERVRVFLQDHFQHILVDEYQDTNVLQSQFTDILAEKSRNIMAVGDDFQCIYTWRGAEFENIMRFPERWPDCKILKLERNYRSVKSVLDVANIVMKDVPHRFEKTLHPARPGAGEAVALYRMWDSRAQSDTIRELVERFHANGYDYSDIAVLYRSHYTSIEIQMTLMREHIPFRITSGVGVFEQLHVKDVLAFLRLCIDAHSELSFMRLLCLLPGVGEVVAKKCWAKLGGSFNGCNGMDRLNLESMMPSRARAAWTNVSQAFEAAEQHLKNGTDPNIIGDFLTFFYAEHLKKQFSDGNEAEDRLKDIQELPIHIATAEGGLAGFLSEVALMTNLDRRVRGSNGMKTDQMLLSTIHQAKGMEWPVVILPWLVQGVCPSQRSIDDGNLDEERRLFYVAVTRAKDRLILLTPRSRRTPEGQVFPTDPSIFVKEIPKELLESHEITTVNSTYLRSQYQHERRYGNSYGGGRFGLSAPGSSTSYKTSWRR